MEQGPSWEANSQEPEDLLRCSQEIVIYD